MGAERSSAPGWSGGRQDSGADEAVLQVVQILGQRRLGEQLVHDGEKVLETPDRLQPVSVGTKRPSCEGEDEGVLDDVKADPASIEGEGRAPVLTKDAAQGSREGEVLIEHAVEVSRLCGLHATSGKAAWT